MFVAPLLVQVPGSIAFNMDIDLYGLDSRPHAFPRAQGVSAQRQSREVLLESFGISPQTQQRPKHHVAADAGEGFDEYYSIGHEQTLPFLPLLSALCAQGSLWTCQAEVKASHVRTSPGSAAG